MARVHYWELSNYNSGTLIGKWFDLSHTTRAEHQAELDEWLVGLTNTTGELCEEWIIGDVEDVPEYFHSEWTIYSTFFEYQETLENSHLSHEVFMAGLSIGFDLKAIEERYRGEYDSVKYFVEEYVEENGVLDDMPDHLIEFFDMEAYGERLMDEYTEFDNHFFYNQ